MFVSYCRVSNSAIQSKIPSLRINMSQEESAGLVTSPTGNLGKSLPSSFLMRFKRHKRSLVLCQGGQAC